MTSARSNSTTGNDVATTTAKTSLADNCTPFEAMTTEVCVLEGTQNIQEWLDNRVWAWSGCRLATGTVDVNGISSDPKRCKTWTQQVYFPTCTKDVAGIVRWTAKGDKEEEHRQDHGSNEAPGSKARAVPIALVCGGHEASNQALVANNDAITLDLCKMKQIIFSDDHKYVTIGAGVLFEELVMAVSKVGKVLPVGTGATVGVVGYVVNGGLSGYFSRRLGLLGQRVTAMTVVDANGRVFKLSNKDRGQRGELFIAMLGAGSALGIATELTLELADESAIRSGSQYVLALDQAADYQDFLRHGLLPFLKTAVFQEDGASMEVVVTADKTIIVTLVYYDSLSCRSPEAFVQPLLNTIHGTEGVHVLAESQWTNWFEIASALWPVIGGMKGSPLAMLQRCCGTRRAPTDQTLDFVVDTFVGETPFDEAPMTICEIRTLGGAIRRGRKIPSGNCSVDFFADSIVCYDAASKSEKERLNIAQSAATVTAKARQVHSLVVDFSGTHSQADEVVNEVLPEDIFGDRETASRIRNLKREIDPQNRFRFNPFNTILA